MRALALVLAIASAASAGGCSRNAAPLYGITAGVLVVCAVGFAQQDSGEDSASGLAAPTLILAGGFALAATVSVLVDRKQKGAQ